jgi:hypothetical protein
MNNDRRQNGKPLMYGVEKLLNRDQLSALLQNQQSGWRLWFIRRPLFPDRVPVLYNVTQNQVGILETDGRISTDVTVKVRSERIRHQDLNFVLQLVKSSERSAQGERRRGQAAVREKPEELLNPHQRRALREIESTGWQLLFVRTSLFRAPVVIIANPENDILATLEYDGQMNMTPDLSLRKDDRSIRTENGPDTR